MSRWWNPRYSIGAEPLAAVVLEPREGGRWYERGETGAECDWGRLLVWHPPRRVVLDWQITAAWQHDPDTHTTVDVRFTEERTGATRVELVHDGLEVLGHEAEAVRATFDGPGGVGRPAAPAGRDISCGIGRELRARPSAGRSAARHHRHGRPQPRESPGS